MAMVEGVGDEVVEFMVAVMLVAIAMLAWWSTNARPSRYRTVLVMRSRVHPVTVSIRTVSSSHMPVPSEGTSSNGRVIPVQEMDSIIDADMAMLNNQRLHFYRRIDAPSASPGVAEDAGEGAEGGDGAGGERAGAAQIHEMESIVSAMEADVTHVRANTQPLRNVPESLATATNGEVGSDQNDASSSNPSEQNETSTEEPSGEMVGNRSKILIKLKYLNDTLKEVEGCLDELLKDFKWRHFSTELSSARLVRLVYRGRVLPDASTLRDCGLHHRAVVHCLVHNNQRGGAGGAGAGAGAAGGAARADGAVLAEAAPPERAWDLENILMTIVSVVLTVIWFFRCEYSNLFTASASVALFGLTVFYSVSIFGLYLAEAIPLDVRAMQAPATAPAPAPARPSLNTDN